MLKPVKKRRTSGKDIHGTCYKTASLAGASDAIVAGASVAGQGLGKGMPCASVAGQGLGKGMFVEVRTKTPDAKAPMPDFETQELEVVAKLNECKAIRDSRSASEHPPQAPIEASALTSIGY